MHIRQIFQECHKENNMTFSVGSRVNVASRVAALCYLKCLVFKTVLASTKKQAVRLVKGENEIEQ